MSPVDRYLAELGAALRTRGAARRRFLRECRDHLADAAAERGEATAVGDFGPAAEIAAAFDAEVASRRGVRSTLATAAAVLATGGSTLALIHASETHVAAPLWWVVAFFIGAQIAGVTAGLALLQALVLRRSTMAPAELMVLARRNGCALVAAGVTIFAAGAAAPGSGSAVLILAGPALLCVAMPAVLRTRALTRRLDGAAAPALRPPLADLGRLVRLPVPAVPAPLLLSITALVAATAAFMRDRGDEHAAVGHALATAGVEAAAVVACFILLGPALGLWRR